MSILNFAISDTGVVKPRKESVTVFALNKDSSYAVCLWYIKQILIIKCLKFRGNNIKLKGITMCANLLSQSSKGNIYQHLIKS